MKKERKREMDRQQQPMAAIGGSGPVSIGTDSEGGKSTMTGLDEGDPFGAQPLRSPLSESTKSEMMADSKIRKLKIEKDLKNR